MHSDVHTIQEQATVFKGGVRGFPLQRCESFLDKAGTLAEWLQPAAKMQLIDYLRCHIAKGINLIFKCCVRIYVTNGESLEMAKG
jgi:hypothetical protein